MRTEQDGPVKVPARIRRMGKEELDAECRRAETELLQKKVFAYGKTGKSGKVGKAPCKTTFNL